MKRTLAFLFFWTQSWGVAASGFELYEVNDSAALAELWQSVGAEGDPSRGHYQILVRKDSTRQQVSLLREGTQAMALPEFVIAMLPGRATRLRPEHEENVAPGDSETVFWRGLMVPLDTLIGWMQWPTGFEAGWRTAFTSLRSVKPQFERHLDFLWTQRPHRFATVQVGLHRSSFAGGLRQTLFNPQDTAIGLDYWGRSFWWWNFALGVPGLKWELALANSPFPEFYWLDTRAKQASQYRVNGSLIRQWTEGTRLPGNLSQSLHARVGALRYSAILDFDAYRFPVQYLRLEELPAPFGQWGFGLLTGRSTVFTRFWMDLFPLSFDFPRPLSFPTSVRMGFVRFEISFRDEQEYHFSLSTRLTLDNPALRLPGAR